MKTDELTAEEMYNLVMEAYASYYLSGEWLKTVTFRYANPIGKFNWMKSNIIRFVGNTMKNGLAMLRTQGIDFSRISEELKQIEEKAKKIKKKTGETFKIENQIEPLLLEKQI
jgi:hypothetical protein